MCCINRFRYVGHAKDSGLGNNKSASLLRSRRDAGLKDRLCYMVCRS
jgi:hypothetical protein